MKRVLTCLAAAALTFAVSGCDEGGGAVKTKKDLAPWGGASTTETKPQPQAAGSTSQVQTPPAAEHLRDAVASLPADPATAKLKLDEIFDRSRASGMPSSALGYAPTQVSAPSQAEIDAKRRALTTAYANSPLHRSGDRDEPVAGTMPSVPLPSSTGAAGDSNVRGGGQTLVAFDAYLRDTFNETGKVFSRAFWGARGSTAREGHQNPTRVTIHHTDGRQTMSVEESRASVKNIQAFHQGPERGWGDIGYHFLVDGAGNVFEGRHADVIGAHVWKHNINNIGIANLGNYNRDQLTDAQKDTLKKLIAFLALKYNTDPRQSGFIEGHHHFSENDTDCPGKNIDAFLPELRMMVDQEAGVQLARNGKRFVPLIVTHPSA